VGDDIDKDGLYDYLAVDVRLDVGSAANYHLHGVLYDNAYTFKITSAHVVVALSPGIQTARLRFDGSAIRNSGVDGPYPVDFTLEEEGLWGIVITDNHLTNPYSCTQFQLQPTILPPEAQIPPEWVPPEDWKLPENWWPDDWWPKEWIPPEDWMPPEEWRPPVDWVPPENWWPENFVPPKGWMPPEEWVPPEKFLLNVVPPWIPSESWIKPEDWVPHEDWVPRGYWSPFVLDFELTKESFFDVFVDMVPGLTITPGESFFFDVFSRVLPHLPPEEHHWIPPPDAIYTSWVWDWDVLGAIENKTIHVHILENAPYWKYVEGNPWTEVENFVEKVLVGGLKIKVKAAASDVILTVASITPPLGIQPPPDVIVGGYFQIGTNIKDNVENAKIGFKVVRSWIHSEKINIKDIALVVLEDGEWKRLPTEMLGGDNDYIYFESMAPGFSIFAVVGRAVAPAAVVLPIPIIIGTAIVAAVVLLIAVLSWKRRIGSG